MHGPDVVIRSFKGDHAFLSNFAQLDEPIPCVPGYAMTSEHAYQACKTRDFALRQRILNAATPGGAKRLGREIPQNRLVACWDGIRVDVMREVLRIKFDLNPRFASLLLATGEAQIVEGNTWGDTFWGVCNGVGENHLGKLLMERRADLKTRTELKVRLVR